MKALFTSAFLLTTGLFCNAQLDPQIKKLTEDKNFFALEEKLNDPKIDQKSREYAQALTFNAFGQYERSIEAVKQYTTNYKPADNDSLFKDLVNTNVDNYYKLSRFKEAANTTQFVIDHFPRITEADEVADLKNTWAIWNGLGNNKPQEVVLNKTTTIPFTRDIAKLVNIEVKHAGGSVTSVFDTGANISVATESTATAMKLDIVADSIKVKAITGNEVYAKIGVCKELSIGDVVIKNAYFLVFPDADLTFGGGVYKINLIVGFPMIVGLGEIIVDQVANTMTVVKNPEIRKHHNLYVDGLTPIIEVKLGKQPMQFSFDSGADKTMFYEKFYTAVKDDKKFEMTPGKSTIGGAGGSKTIDIMVAKHLELIVGDEKVELNNMDVLPANMMDKKEHLYGNLGQDVLRSRKKYVLNLKDMYFELDNN